MEMKKEIRTIVQRCFCRKFSSRSDEKLYPKGRRKSFHYSSNSFGLARATGKRPHNGWWLREDENNDEMATTATSTATIKSVEINSKHFIEIFYLLLCKAKKRIFHPVFCFYLFFMVLFLNFFFARLHLIRLKNGYGVCVSVRFLRLLGMRVRNDERLIWWIAENKHSTVIIISVRVQQMKWKIARQFFLLEFNCGFVFPLSHLSIFVFPIIVIHFVHLLFK